MRLILALGAGVLALLCMGGVGVIVSLYDEATEIKRTAPDAVADSFLRAYLVNRDDEEASLYTCKSGPDLSQVAALRQEMFTRERDYGVDVVIDWGGLVVSKTVGGRRTVSTDIFISGISDGVTKSRRSETWSLDLIDQNGWRVCGAHKVG
ncbi:hypothetical protein [Mangrovihabitans endophyticus]|uniref:Uncharacterized protein n=1 Tax=Mangrovihabitans endophyticus TaxID=1751298 RepID=A0A8J3C3M5_9ACTN|nr:hypothetical protein [Mangrovihabitans endophyticus]GGL03363.1 hypothetical protein GCM10012284_42450 [Mangrovihabitans endophyticus]